MAAETTAASPTGPGQVRFSVVVPAFNAAETLAATVRSALAQMPADDFEVIISDDGSSDATLALAREFEAADPRVRVVTAPNGGCSSARNRAIDVACGEYFIPLDSDDLLDPGYLSGMSAFIAENPGYDIYSCNGTRRFGGGGEEPFLIGPAYANETSWTLSDLIPEDRIFLMAVVRRELWQRLGGYRTDLRHAEDYDFWLRALAAGATHRYLPERLATAVFRAQSKSKNLIAHAEAQLRMFADLAENPAVAAAERKLIAAKRASLKLRIRRVELEERLQRGETVGARREYLAVRNAYRSRGSWAAGLVAMLVSPRVYARLFAARSARKAAR